MKKFGLAMVLLLPLAAFAGLVDEDAAKSQVAVPVVAAAVTPVQIEVVKKQVWAVEVQDITLAKTLDRWAATAGWRVRWDADKHVLIAAPAVYAGSLEEAIASVLATPGIRNSPYPLEACIYANKPPLVRVTRMGDQSTTCSAAE